MKILSTFYLIFFVYQISLCQSNSNNPEFLIHGEVKDRESGVLIDKAEIRIIGTDGTETILLTDSTGTFEHELKNKTSYVISVYKTGYLISKGKETTTGKYKSLVFVHDYNLEPTYTIHEGFYNVDFDSVFSLSLIDFNSDTITLFRRNDFVKKDNIKYTMLREVDNIYQIFNNTNKSTRSIQIELIDTSLVKITHDKSESIYWLIAYSSNHKYWYNLIKKD